MQFCDIISFWNHLIKHTKVYNFINVFRKYSENKQRINSLSQVYKPMCPLGAKVIRYSHSELTVFKYFTFKSDLLLVLFHAYRSIKPVFNKWYINTNET